MTAYSGRPRRRGRRILLAVLVLALAGALFLLDQQNRIQVEEITVSSPRLPSALDGVKIVQVSDLHGKTFGAESKKLLRAVAAQSPDLIAITGDLIEDPKELAMVPSLAAGLAKIAPTYYVTGNHEWSLRLVPELYEILRENGVQPLSNEHILFERNGASLVVAGVEDPNGPYDQKTPMQVMAAARAAVEDPFVLLLAHRNNPLSFHFPGAADLTLCGHGHGGILRYYSPFTHQWEGLLGTDRRFFPKNTAGLWATGDGEAGFISRGLGNVGMSLRVFNRPHLPVITLKTQ
ncbi:MAG: metallophosphoesterase [Pseudoflavonifractor sp.]